MMFFELPLYLVLRNVSNGLLQLTDISFHEVVRVLAILSRNYGGVQWVFGPPVHTLGSSDNPSD